VGLEDINLLAKQGFFCQLDFSCGNSTSLGFGVDCGNDCLGGEVHQPELVRADLSYLLQPVDGVFMACDSGSPNHHAIRQYLENIVDAIHGLFRRPRFRVLLVKEISGV
jgi:hypothetical protein